MLDFHYAIVFVGPRLLETPSCDVRITSGSCCPHVNFEEQVVLADRDQQWCWQKDVWFHGECSLKWKSADLPFQNSGNWTWTSPALWMTLNGPAKFLPVHLFWTFQETVGLQLWNACSPIHWHMLPESIVGLCSSLSRIHRCLRHVLLKVSFSVVRLFRVAAPNFWSNVRSRKGTGWAIIHFSMKNYGAKSHVLSPWSWGYLRYHWPPRPQAVFLGDVRTLGDGLKR